MIAYSSKDGVSQKVGVALLMYFTIVYLFSLFQLIDSKHTGWLAISRLGLWKMKFLSIRILLNLQQPYIAMGKLAGETLVKLWSFSKFTYVPPPPNFPSIWSTV